MAFDNKTNHNRVAKIIDILDLIEASRVSNKASEDEMASIIKPLFDRLGSAPEVKEEVPETEVKPKENKQYGMAPHPWTTIRQCANKAKPKDLLTAYTIIGSRLDEYIYDLEQKVSGK